MGLKDSNLVEGDYLSQCREEEPAWLDAYVPQADFDVESMFCGNSLYWTEAFKVDSGAPIRVLNEAHAVHLFIYASCYYLHSWCDRDNRLKGYSIIDERALSLDEVAPRWGFEYTPVAEDGDVGPFCKLYVYQRDDDCTDAHGARRIALLEIGGDTIDLYGRLFCSRPGRKAPFMIGIGDYTGKTPFGKGYRDSKVAKGGCPDIGDQDSTEAAECGMIGDYDPVMERMAVKASKFPRLIYTFGPRTMPWRGYEKLPDDCQACWCPMEYGKVYRRSKD